MRIEDLKDYEVRISANTLTAKDENGKTRGLVRGTKRFKDAPLRVQVDACGIAKKAGVNRADLFAAGAIVYENNLIFLHDTRKRDEKYLAAIDRIKAAGLTVIPVARVIN